VGKSNWGLQWLVAGFVGSEGVDCFLAVMDLAEW